MELRDVLAALRTGWWLPLVGLVVGGAAAVAVSIAQPNLYTASTQLFVSTTDTSSTTAAYQGSQFSQQRVTSYAALITGPDLSRRVIDQLRLRTSPKQLQEEITATAVTNTVLIDVTVTDRSPQQAQRIAAAVGSEFITYSGQLEATGPLGLSPVKVTVTRSPDVPTSPSSPKTARNVALGLLAGLLVGAGLAVARAQLDRSVKDPEDVAHLVHAPVIGTVLRDEALEKEHTIERTANSRTAEDYRQLRNNLQFLSVDEPPKIILVSSAVPSEGKTTLVVNLAIALAEAGQKVTVVEADLRKPKVTRYLGMVSGVGLTNVLAGTADLEDVTQTFREGVTVIASGPHPPNPGELLGSSHMATILEKLRGQSDFVLIDAPPLLPVADSTGLAVHTDGVVLSVRYGSTHKEQLQQAANALDRVGARVLGVVLNIVPPKAQLASAYGYGYEYGYSEEKSA